MVGGGGLEPIIESNQLLLGYGWVGFWQFWTFSDSAAHADSENDMRKLRNKKEENSSIFQKGIFMKRPVAVDVADVESS